MQNFLRFSGTAAAALAFAFFAPSCFAQEKTTTWACQGVGMDTPEPLGDREGHLISVGQYSCRAEFGPVGRQRRDRCRHVGVGRPESHPAL